MEKEIAPKQPIFSRIKAFFKPTALPDNILPEQIKKTPHFIRDFLWQNFKEVYHKSHQKEFLKLFSFQGAQAFSTSLLPKLSGLTVGALTQMPLFLMWSGTSGIILALNNVLGNKGGILRESLLHKLKDNIRSHLTEQVIRQTESYRASIGSNKISAYIDQAANSASSVYNMLPQAAERLIISFSCVITALTINWIAGLATLSGMGVYGYFVVRSHPFFRKTRKIATKGFVSTTTRYRDAITTARPVQENNYTNELMEKNKRKSAQNISRMQKLLNLIIPLQIKANMIEILTTTSIPILVNILTGGDISSFMTITMATAMLTNNTKFLLFSYNQITQNTSEIQTALNQLSCKKEYQIQTGEKTCSQARLNIQMNNVSFAYPDQDAVLNNMNLDIYPGELTVLIGTSGAGKSTLFRLIKHQMDPQQGNIKIDGIPLTELNEQHLHEQVCLVSGEPSFLNASLRDNLRIFKNDASDSEIKEVLTAVGLDQLDLNRKIGGNTLSTGQKQRVALAQAFLKQAPITLLDEPTSALDRETKELVLNSLKKFASDPNKTVLMIAHNEEEILSGDRGIVIKLKNTASEQTLENTSSNPNLASQAPVEQVEGIVEEGPIYSLDYVQRLIKKNNLEKNKKAHQAAVLQHIQEEGQKQKKQAQKEMPYPNKSPRRMKMIGTHAALRD